MFAGLRTPGGQHGGCAQPVQGAVREAHRSPLSRHRAAEHLARGVPTGRLQERVGHRVHTLRQPQKGPAQRGMYVGIQPFLP